MVSFFGKKKDEKNADSEQEEAKSQSGGSWFSKHFSASKPAEPAAPAETPAPAPTPALAPAPAPAAQPKPAPAKETWFSKLRRGLTKTRVNLYGLFSGGVIDEDFLENLQDALIAADTGLPASEKIIEELRESIKLKGLKTQEEVRGELIDIITRMLKPSEQDLDIERAHPLVIMMAGINGAGKTTSIGKIAKWLAARNKSVLLAAGDTFRAAAADQLEIWAERAGCEIVRQYEGADPGAVLCDALQAAKARNVDVVLCDTAGRLHNKANLMAELAKLSKIIDRECPDCDRETLLVLDATTGQNGLIQARTFKETAGLTGIVLTKLDGTAKGGIVIAIARELGVPVKFAGVGEGIDDLKPFDARSYVEAII